MIDLINACKKFVIPDKTRATLFRNIISGARGENSHKIIWALNKVNINIQKGEALGIIGPNGSGKSTLLRIISGIYKPTSGMISVKGEMTTVLQLGIGFLSDLSVRENVFLFGTIMGLKRREISRNFSRIIDFAELNEFINAEVRTLSLGMKERLAFSITIKACRDILLLDETLAVGDERFRGKCSKVMKRLKEEGKTIILSSHNLNLVENFCDRVVLLNKGSVIACGNPRDVINKYISYSSRL